jgi:hypothetical protein
MMTKLLGLMDTPGGHMLICLVLIAAGVACVALRLDVSKDVLVVFALGVIGRSMLGQNGKGAA